MAGSYFDRFDICEAYYCFAVNYHGGQWSIEYALHATLDRLGFKPGLHGDRPEGLTDNGQAIYHGLVESGGSSIRDRR
jgi:hypothetical protein